MFDPELLPVPDLGLRCLSCGYNLAGLPRHLCPECGRKIRLEEHIPPGEFPMLILNGQRVPATDEIRGLLRRYRLPFMENKVHSETIMISVGPAAFSAGHLCVAREIYFEAIDLLRRHMLGERMPEAPTSTEGADEWICTGCGEANPGHFEVCWNCEAVRMVVAT